MEIYMEFIMDMVHHNPGEAPFKSKFLNPKLLKSYGYNSQVFKHINTAVDFSALGEFFVGEDEKKWINNIQSEIHSQISAAKSENMNIFYHIDLFVLPKRLADQYKDEILDEDGKISLKREKTKELHRIMFDEIFEKFPQVDGLIVRVGETYLHDTPYHTGNGAIKYGNRDEEIRDFIELINFLREEICVKHGKYLFFRTWDIFSDKFHSSPEYYLAVTDNVEPHEKLLFSIKHTIVDFWRRVRFNPCLTIGKHNQVVEIQCQREYEGKGAYPNYIMNGVINSFDDNKSPKGLRDIADNPKIKGIYTWSRGGGWYGPYISNEFWCDINVWVIANYANNPARTEEEIFYDYAENKMGLDRKNAEKFREMCFMASRALLKGRYVECYDRTLDENCYPCRLWMRDDRLGGLKQLDEVFRYLNDNDLLFSAVLEKKESVLWWNEVRRAFKEIEIPDKELCDYIETSIEYACGLFNVIYCGWRAMAEGYTGGGRVSQFKADYYKAWEDYRKVSDRKDCASLYTDLYLNDVGMGDTIENLK